MTGQISSPLAAQLVKQLHYVRFKQVMHGIRKTTLPSGAAVSGACSFLIHYGAVESLTSAVYFENPAEKSKKKKKKKATALNN